MSKEIENIQKVGEIFEKLQEKLENIDENTNLDKLVKELKEMQKNLDIKK